MKPTRHQLATLAKLLARVLAVMATMALTVQLLSHHSPKPPIQTTQANTATGGTR